MKSKEQASGKWQLDLFGLLCDAKAFTKRDRERENEGGGRRRQRSQRRLGVQVQCECSPAGEAAKNTTLRHRSRIRVNILCDYKHYIHIYYAREMHSKRGALD